MQRRSEHFDVDGKTSAWLAVLPLCTHHFDLSATEFRDALAMRYQRPLLRMPATCDGCGVAFNLEYALDCRKGGGGGGGWSSNAIMKSEMHWRSGLNSIQECDKGANCEGG